ncbi:Nn.00g008610.m01.CDS01 [Neocucurbitaria sp. VM-36]
MPLLLKKMETRRLHNSDMKKLVRILRNVPFPSSSSKDISYQRHTKANIQDLPRRLRSSHLSLSTSNLCTTHKGLDANLIADIWAWLRHEVDGAIGKFLYPLIMCGVLTKNQELKMRQLEPVQQMWYPDFTMEMSAPPGRRPAQCGSKWCYQIDQCPACMLARIGSDEDVMFALFAGMVGRMKDKATGIDVLRGMVGLEKARSKRLRFVRYWIRASRGGDSMVFEAGELGIKMKRLRHEWKVEQRYLRDAQHLDRTTHNSYEVERRRTTSEVGHRQGASVQCDDTGSVIGIDITEPYQPKEWSPSNAHDPKLGPNPRPSNVMPLSPAAPLGFDISSLRDSDSRSPNGESRANATLARPHSNGSDTTVHPGSSVSVAQLRPRPLRPKKSPTKVSAPSVHDASAKQPRHSRQDSVLGDLPSLTRHLPSTRRPGQQPSIIHSLASTRTIMSYDGCASSRTPVAASRNIVLPLDSPVYEIPQTQEQLVEKYRAMLAAHSEAYCISDGEDDPSSLPRPRPNSMYSSFGNRAFDDNAYEAADEECEDEGGRDKEVGQCSPLQTPNMGTYRRPSVASTAWDDLY